MVTKILNISFVINYERSIVSWLNVISTHKYSKLLKGTVWSNKHQDNGAAGINILSIKIKYQVYLCQVLQNCQKTSAYKKIKKKINCNQ